MRLLVYFSESEISVEQVSDAMCRLAWHFDRNYKIDFLLYGEGLPELVPPEYLDSKLASLVNKSIKSGLTRSVDIQAIKMEVYGAILNFSNLNERVVTDVLAEQGVNSRVLNVDHRNIQYAASILLKVTSSEGKGSLTQLKKYSTKLKILVEELRAQYDRTYIFGTGPNLAHLDFSNLNEGLFIATNSMVVNDELMAQINPRVIVASDPIFHAGPSRYAERFREKLFTAMRKYSAYFIFPMRDVGVWENHTPEDLKGLLIGVPLKNEVALNSNLDTKFYTSSTANVMTLFLLPLAATIGNPIVLGGFDGRPIDENDYYWKHDPNNQISEEMESIRLAHPAFFAIDFDEYYFNHHAKVAEYISTIIHECGLNIVNLTDSFMPAISALSTQIVEERPEISLIMATFNADENFETAVLSVLEQSYTSFELIIVDDGSTNDTLVKANRWKAMDKRVSVISKQNGGVSSARNLGIVSAQGRYVGFLDDDDVLSKESLLKRYEAARHYKGAAAVFGRTQMINDRGEIILEFGALRAIRFPQFATFPMHISSVLLPYEKARQIRFDESMENGEDWKYFAELARRGLVYHPLKRVVSCYRIHQNSVTGKNLHQHSIALLCILDWLNSDFWGYGFYPTKNQVGLNPKIIEREKLLRLVSALITSLYKGSNKDIIDIAGYMDAKFSRNSNPLPDQVDQQVCGAVVRMSASSLNSENYNAFIDINRSLIKKRLNTLSIPHAQVVMDSISKNLLEPKEMPTITNYRTRKALDTPASRGYLYKFLRHNYLFLRRSSILAPILDRVRKWSVDRHYI